MNLTYDIDNKIRFIVLYQDVTKTPTRIAKHTGIPLSTVYDWIHKVENGQDILEVEKGRGGKPVIDKNVARNLIRKSQRSPENSSTRNLGSQYNISKSSAYNVLKGKGL